jgi:hypothetical protein
MPNKQYRCSGAIRSATGDKSAFRHFQRWTKTRSKIPADTILRRVGRKLGNTTITINIDNFSKFVINENLDL